MIGALIGNSHLHDPTANTAAPIRGPDAAANDSTAAFPAVHLSGKTGARALMIRSHRRWIWLKSNESSRLPSRIDQSQKSQIVRLV